MARSVIGALRVVLGLDSAQFETGVRRVSRTNQQLVKNTQVAATAIRSLGAALGVVSAGAAARGYLSLADQSAQLTAQLKLATRETGSFAKAQADVQRIAAASRSSLGETANLYATFQRNARELGITQDDAARATETITKAFKISGATAAEAAGGLRQLLQGIQSGTLRGEELNSVLENAPRLARALADGLGITIGQLREMGSEGKLTGRAVIDALGDAAEQIDAEFSELPVTFDDAMAQLHNSAVITFGAFDRGGQFSTAIANFITQGTEGFADLERDATELGIEIRSTFEGLADVFEPLVAAAKSAFGEIGSEAQTLADRIRPLLGEIDAITAWGASQEGPIEQWINKRVWGSTSTGGTNLLETFNRRQRESETNLRRANGQTPVSRTLQRLSEARNSGSSVSPAPAATGGGGGRKGGGGRSAEAARKAAEREAQRAADNLRRFTDELARQQASLRTSLAELTRSVEARADAELNEIEVRRQTIARDIQADDTIDQAKREQLLLLNDQNAKARADLVRQELADDLAERSTRIEEDRHNLAIDLLRSTSALARTSGQAREVELRIIDHAFAAERARLEQIKATNAVTSAEYAYADARLRALPELQSAANATARQGTMGPMEQFLDGLPRSADEAREALERVQVDGINGIVDGLAAAATGAASLGDVFKGVANQIIADLIRIQLQKAIVGGLSNSLGGLFGGGGPTINGVSGSDFVSNFKVDSLPGFSTGGSFRVGGSSTVGDRNLVAFRANAGEMVDIRRPGNDNGGGQIVNNFYGPGAQEFWAEIDGRASGAANSAVVNNNVRQTRKGQRRLGR